MNKLAFRGCFSVVLIASLLLVPLVAAQAAEISDIPSLDELAGEWNATSELCSFPAINSSRGAAKANNTNILAVDNIGFPPIFASGTACVLKINGTPVIIDKTKWLPYQVLRCATVSNALEIETTVQLAASENAVLFRVTLRNASKRPQGFPVQVDLGSLPVSVKEKMWWNPRPATTKGFLATVESGALVIRNPDKTLAAAYAFSTAPDSLQAVGKDGGETIRGEAVWNLNLLPGETKELFITLACGTAGTDPVAISARLAGDWKNTVAQAKAGWDKRWKAMFEPGNKIFSGNLPKLTTTDAAVRRVYYMSLVSLLSVCRDGFPLQPRVYVSNSPEYNCTMMYFWDDREFATVFALLDPAMMRKCLLDWLTLDIHKGYAEDYLSGKLQGPFYSANDYSIFLLAVTYLSGTGDREFLNCKAGDKTVLQHLNAIATHWKTQVRPGRALADYGEAPNLLECVPTYIHEVPSLNAANIWMMRQMAKIDELNHDKGQADKLRADAATLLPQVLALYEPGQGCWDSLHRDGTRVPMRHVFDFATIGLTLGNDLDTKTRADMVSFVKKELLTDTWMRAQSLQDVAAAHSNRPDHGPMGAFSAWPAETAAVFCEFGDYPDALDIFHRVVKTTSEGPFSQSRELLGKEHDSPARIALRGLQAYNASNAASFAETVIRGLFGYAPDYSTEDPVSAFSDSKLRGFSGELRNVRFHGALYDITLDAKGRHIRKLNEKSMKADAPAALPPPPQDQALPYTRSALPAALNKIKGGIAVFPGSRYGYVKGYRVRLSDTDLLRAEAVLKDGVIYVPASFAAVLDLGEINPAPPPADLAPIVDRWVYAPEELAPRTSAIDPTTYPAKLVFNPPPGLPSISVRGSTYYSLADLAKIKGLKVTQHPRGLLYLGDKELTFGDNETALLESVITLFDTPEKFADPDIATRSIPTLARQGKWTDHVKVTPEQLAILNGPETEWPTAPKSEYDYTGFNQKLLGSKVPPPGVYPRLFFSEEDIPMLAARVKSTRVGQMSLIEMEYFLNNILWNPKTNCGQIFAKLASGQLADLKWEVPAGKPDFMASPQFQGEKMEVFGSISPGWLTAMAFYCLLMNDDVHGRQAATAIANYYQLREPLLDQYLKLSDSEFGSSLEKADGSLIAMDGNGSKSNWGGMSGLIVKEQLGPALDFGGKWMTPEQKHAMQRIIAKATYGFRSYGQDGPVRFRDVNWVAWSFSHFLAVATLEGLPGFDPEAYASGAESVRAYCDWGIDDAGVIFESTGKNGPALQFQFLSMVALARRGENLFGHPHWRKLLRGSIGMTSPTGRVMVNSGTQYFPYSRQKLCWQLVTELKGFYPESRLPDYWLSCAPFDPSADLHMKDLQHFSAEDYRRKVSTIRLLRMPCLNYIGWARGVLYDGDIQPTTFADLNLPLDFNAPVQGAYSSRSDRTPEAVWMHLYVRPNHYLGAGHHHADAGMFHFSALGVDWLTQSPCHQAFDGKYFNLVQVDGESEPASIPGGPNGYNGAATYLGAQFAANASIGSADLTYAYTWRWNTQPPQDWSEQLKAMPWELDPTPANLKNWAGTARYKMRLWWPSYTYENYIPTCRAPFNPMQYVYRSTGLVRGAHPYGFVIDDLKKDNANHLYQWAGMLNGGVWKADVPGLASNQIALATSGVDPNLHSNASKLALIPKEGDPLLLVCALGMKMEVNAKESLFQVETVEGLKDFGGKAQYYDRLMINQKASEVAYKILLLPIKAGEPLPKVSYDNANQTARIEWPGQSSDTLKFNVDASKRTLVEIKRGKKILLGKQ
jgi:hypothetical protein